MGRKKSWIITPGQYYYARRKFQFAAVQYIFYILIIGFIFGFIIKFIIPIIIIALIIGSIVYYNKSEKNKEIEKQNTESIQLYQEKINKTRSYIENIITNKTIPVIDRIQEENVFLKQKCTLLFKTVSYKGELILTDKRLFIIGDKQKSINYDKIFKTESPEIQVNNPFSEIVNVFPNTGNTICIKVEYALEVRLLIDILKGCKNPLELTDNEVDNLPTIGITGNLGIN
jgi:hypothetical protein